MIPKQKHCSGFGNECIYQKSNVLFVLLGSLMIVCFMTISLLEGTDFCVKPNDQLDSEVLYYFLKAKYGFSNSYFDCFMNGKAFVQVPCVVPVILYKIFPGVYAFIINKYIVMELSFIGMYLFLNCLNIEKPFSFMVALLFSITPFFSVYGLTVMGLPMIACCYIFIYKKRRLFISYLGIIVFSLYSSFLLSGFAVCGLLILSAVILIVKDRKITWRFVIGVLLLVVFYLFLNKSIIGVQFLNSTGFMSHRLEIVKSPVSYTQFWNDYIKDSLYNVHAMSLHEHFVLIYLLALIASLFYSKYDHCQKAMIKLYVALLFILFAIHAFSFLVVSSVGVSVRKNIFGNSGLASFAFERIIMIAPALWYSIYGIAISVLYTGLKRFITVHVLDNTWEYKNKNLNYKLRFNKLVPIILIGLLSLKPTVYIVAHSELINEFRTEKENVKNGFIPWNRFFEPELLKEVKEEIGYDLENNKVISVGIYPSIALYNELYCIDGYSNYYELSYKHSFAQMIEPELEKSESIKDYFLKWGNRCYAFSAEIGKNYYPENNCVFGITLNYDMNQFKKLGGRYIISAYNINNSNDLGLREVRTIRSNQSYYQIYLYRTE